MTAPTPVLRFLPDADLSTGPFGLLGLPPGPIAAEQVDPALHRQLARLARHPLGRTTEADEVRLALHVAAAQLRDPRVQEELLLDLATMRRRQPSPAPSASAAPTPSGAPAPAPAPVPRPAPVGLPSALDQAALAVIVYSGGWNRESQRRLASLAHVFNADFDALQGALARLSARRAPVAEGAPVPVSERAAAAPIVEATRRARWAAPAVLGATLLGSVIMGAVLWRMTRPLSVPPASAPIVASPGPTGSGVPLAPEGAEAPPVEAAATPGRRSESKERRAEAVAPERAQPETAETVARWAAAAHRSAAGASSADPTSALRSAERLARLNLAAVRLLAGDGGPLDQFVNGSGSFTGSPSTLEGAGASEPDLRAVTAFAVAPDGDLAELILLARRSPGQNIDSLKRRMAPTHALGPADCDALANAAFVGSPPEIRSIARRFIEPQLDNAFMIHALLEALPIAPARDEVASLLEQACRRRLPRPTRAEWRLEARRALLTRLAEVIASPDKDTDALAESILSSWRATTGTGPASPGDPNASPDQEAGAALFAWWRDRAAAAATGRDARAVIDAIVQQRELERILAQGAVQRAAIDQRASAALLGFIVARERPAVAPQVEHILDLAAERRAHARHVFQQIEITERAVTALWFLRLGLDAPEESP